MDTQASLPAKLMILISLVQGLCLLYLHQAIELRYWPHEQPEWLFAFYSVSFVWPIILLLGLSENNWRAMIKLTLPFAFLSGFLGFYMGNQVTPIEYLRFDALLFSFVVTMTIASFKVLMYCQQWVVGERVTYSALFLWSWRNFLTLSLSLLFTACFWLILMLWGSLFKTININFFQNLFEERWFYYPILTLANGFGVIIFRNLTHIIDTITRLQQALMKFLLVVLSLVSLLFLGALPFTGLEPLWNNGGSFLILWMQALILFFVNAVYQDEPSQWPYPLWLHRFIYISLVALPIYSIISCYGLSLRISQHGWSLSRYWAYLIWFLLALFPLGYWWGIAKYRDGWVHQLSKVNVVIGLVVLGAMLVVNSPLLDFRKMVVANQMQRLSEKKLSLDNFDINYFRYQLGRPGYEALQMLKADYGSENPSLVVRINALYASKNTTEPSSTREEFIATITFLSDNPPEELLTKIYQEIISNKWNLMQTKQYYLRTLDVDANDELEYIWIERSDRSITISLYYIDASSWQHFPVATFWQGNINIDQFVQSLNDGDVKAVQPRWNDIVIGENRIEVGISK